MAKMFTTTSTDYAGRLSRGKWVREGLRFYSTRFRSAGDGGEILDNDGVIYPPENIW